MTSSSSRLKPTEATLGKERAVLVGALLAGEPEPGEKVLEELAALIGTVGAAEVGRVTQRIRKVSSGYYIGRGKADELAAAARSSHADAVVFDNDLTPAQQRNLERVVGRKVVDRTEVILSIFARRARTKQAKMQVELARLQYALPRLRGMWTHLERQVGGIGVRAGMGERQIEMDRRRVRRRIHDLSKELEKLQARRRREVGSREEFFTVSLVGYTNAGKSSLLRALTGKKVFIEDKLFATLDTKTAAMQFTGGHKILLSDTVGFIRHLPHRLVASFHATLEEVLQADLLLHVVDASHTLAPSHIRAVEGVLREIGADGKETLRVLNKSDLAGTDPLFRALVRENRGAVVTSALHGDGIDDLRERILQIYGRKAEELLLAVPASDGKALDYLARHAFVLEKECRDAEMLIRARISPGHLERFLGTYRGVRVLGE